MNSEDTKAARARSGPLAGTPYDFRKLYPELMGWTTTSAADPEIRPAAPARLNSTRRGMFQFFRPGKAKP